jgi:hypothetical protein
VDNSANAVKINSALHPVGLPVVGQLVAGFLPGHALLNPLVAAPHFLPVVAGAIQALRRIGDFLHPLITHLGQPLLEGLGLG